ncbi:reverse transcriptase/maturase family protein [Chryseobacterium sp. NRRL B-14798]|uniref:reverse transcriptase/maturase family protein n=1 Tax=Chryseobacterium sp. NRRL B-14798 TaxID=3162880 RepID=UPI003D215018
METELSELKYNLFAAYYEARRNKRNTYDQLRFEICYEKELFQLYEEIKNGTYTIGKSIAFIIDKPVKREIFAANFRDRIVHHLMFNYLNPIIEPLFIEDSYSCRKGKGTSFGIRRAYDQLKMITSSFTKDAYILKLDIKSYFMSINKNRLMKKLRDIISENTFKKSRYMASGGNVHRDIDYDSWFGILEKVVYHDPTTKCTIKGKVSHWEKLPDSKSIFKSAPDCGLPIGNLTSQLFSNVYLNDFDHYMKDALKIEHYGRYVDDFYIFHTSKKEITKIFRRCRSFLLNEGLELHPRKIYLQHYTKGFQFLGVFIKPHKIYIRKRTAKKFKSLIRFYKKSIVDKGEPNMEQIRNLRSVVNSYLGFLKHYNTYNLRYKSIFARPACIFFQYGYFSSNLSKMIIHKPFFDKYPI